MNEIPSFNRTSPPTCTPQDKICEDVNDHGHCNKCIFRLQCIHKISNSPLYIPLSRSTLPCMNIRRKLLPATSCTDKSHIDVWQGRQQKIKLTLLLLPLFPVAQCLDVTFYYFYLENILHQIKHREIKLKTCRNYNLIMFWFLYTVLSIFRVIKRCVEVTRRSIN